MPFPKKEYYSIEMENEYNNDNNYGNSLFGIPSNADIYVNSTSYKNNYNYMNNNSNGGLFQNQSNNIFFNPGKGLFGNNKYNNDLFVYSGGLFGNNNGLFSTNYKTPLFE